MVSLHSHICFFLFFLSVIDLPLLQGMFIDLDIFMYQLIVLFNILLNVFFFLCLFFHSNDSSGISKQRFTFYF